jgi:RHS repeat-associated protein
LNSTQLSDYDLSGNILDDGPNTYLWDAEGRICAVRNTSAKTSATSMTAYFYDAEGRRVSKGALSTWPTACVSPTSTNVAINTIYELGLAGEQVAEFTGSGSSFALKHINNYAAGQLLGTYDGHQSYFNFYDHLGSKRALVSTLGGYTAFASSPYGISWGSIGSAGDPSEHHFTGKERDAESGNDYFSARYYASSMGRFMSPDPILQNDLRLLNPQRWNKYAYVINNPLILTDPTGLDAVYVNFSGMAGGFGHSGVMSVHSDGSATFSYKDGQGQIHMDDSPKSAIRREWHANCGILRFASQGRCGL